jgi:RNA polymerase sigma-70 factor (ECF subfamily)
MDCRPSPIVAMNRAVAVARVQGPERGLAQLAEINGRLEQYYLYHAVRADLLRQLRRTKDAIAAYQLALDCPCSEPEKRFLNAQLAALKPERAD